jgi:hypothetical protein
MRYYECPCGDTMAWGSDSPPPCDPCLKCGSIPTADKSIQTPIAHEFYQEKVETDEGEKVLSRCKYCCRTKKKVFDKEGGPIPEGFDYRA